MLPLRLGRDPEGPLTVLAIGAHSDDVEIGAGGTLLRMVAEVADLRARFVILSATGARAAEAEASAQGFLAPAAVDVEVHDLADGHLPGHWSRVKAVLEATAGVLDPDLILAPSGEDAHQDHATVGQIVRTAFRDHLVLHYEIPKWDGDLGAHRPSVYVPLSADDVRRKVALLHEHFPSQRHRDWFQEETFRSLARLRGMECRSGYAEAFAVPKALLAL